METDTITSYHTDKSYTIKHDLTCTTEGVIYLLNDRVCRRSYVGSTITDMRTRAANYRNHIRTQHKGCEIATHFAEHEDLHPLPVKGGTTTKSEYLDLFNNQLSNQIEFVLIDKVTFPANSTSAEKRIIIEKSEGYWQTQMRTMQKYGGLNIRDERKIKNNKDAKSKAPQISQTSNSTKLVTPPQNNKPPNTRNPNLNPQPIAEDPDQPPLRRSNRIKKQPPSCHLCD